MPEIFAVIYLKLKQRGQILEYFVKMVEQQTVNSPLGAVWFWSVLFAQTDLSDLSENLGSPLQYFTMASLPIVCLCFQPW